MPCRQLLISGRVQGVWFRESMKREAERLGVTGWVCNLPDGRVEAVVCAEDAALEAIVRWANAGPPLAKVNEVMVREAAPGQLTGFEKRVCAQS